MGVERSADSRVIVVRHGNSLQSVGVASRVPTRMSPNGSDYGSNVRRAVTHEANCLAPLHLGEGLSQSAHGAFTEPWDGVLVRTGRGGMSWNAACRARWEVSDTS